MARKALVVDDNQDNLLLERDLLEVAGFEVFEADNATAGIAIARKELPDVIVMDMRLPDMRRLRSRTRIAFKIRRHGISPLSS